ncbi:MAG: Serine protease/ABC transporter B family protein TagC [Thermoanaerobacterales bacterium 50_218]|nr:MAG: Serine protease/ABC transporter B family protein TagC [Thermoanaerobacterales bacterium 50_218]
MGDQHRSWFATRQLLFSAIIAVVLVLAVVFCSYLVISTNAGQHSAEKVPSSPGEPTAEKETAGERETGARDLFVLPASPIDESTLSALVELGAEPGDALGDSGFLVRLPAGRYEEISHLLGEAPEPYPPEKRIHPRLQEKLDSPGKEVLQVEVTLFREGDKDSLARLVEDLGGRIERGLEEPGRVLRVQIPAEHLKDLAGFPEVVYIEPVVRHHLLNNRAADIVGAVPLNVSGFLPEGLTGSGQFIGIADSGLDLGSMEDIHPDLASRPGQIPKVVMLKSWAGASSAADPVGHGTHVAATVAGTGAASNGKFRGIAPGASIYFQALLDAKGEIAPPPDLTAMFAPAYEAGVRVHLNAWGGEGGGYLGHASQVDRFVRDHPDFLVVFGSGNNGPAAGTLTPEAHTKNGLVVGASQNPRPALDPDQVDASRIASFSSRGPTSDGRLKPEILAPGALVSVCSRLVTGNFKPDPDYTYLEGTSMAAAVAAGSATLLREYFQEFEGVKSPSAALLKAALINGARPLEDSGGSFGVLDLMVTVLSLREDTFGFVDSGEGVTAGDALSFTFEVDDPSSPLKVTLAWTDPPAAPGAKKALVNNLDLVVRDPGGREYWGNSFLFGDHPDDVNNVEQVIIPNPLPGRYTIIVRGTEIRQDAVPVVPGKNQDFALVFGQPLRRDVIAGVGDGSVTLASGQELRIDPEKVRLVRDGVFVDLERLVTGSYSVEDRNRELYRLAANRLPGADIYFSAGFPEHGLAYVVSRSWKARGIQVFQTSEGTLLAEVNPEVREGGYLLVSASRESLLVNGTDVDDFDAVPPGGEVRGLVNPSSQTLWQAGISYQQVEGFLDRADPENRKVFLIGEPEPYQLAQDAVITYTDELADADPADLPFGAVSSPGWEALLPGLRVQLVCSPETGEVIFLGAKRRLAVGTVTAVAPQEGKVVLSTGKAYQVQPGISVVVDGKSSSLEQLLPGMHLIAVLFPDSPEVLSLAAHSSFTYGQVVYASSKERIIYLLDQRNRFRVLEVAPEAEVFRWGLPGGLELVEPGIWGRFYLDPGTGQVARLDLAETRGEKREVLLGYDTEKGELYTSSGTYVLSGHTLVTKNGYPVTADDLLPGEEVRLTPLLATVGEKPLLAIVAAEVRPSVKPPRLEVAAPWRGSHVVVSGATTADRLYIYFEGGQRKVVPIEDDGRFVCLIDPEGEDLASPKGEIVVQLVAVDSRTGGVTGQFLTIPPGVEKSFSDLEGHWAAADVEVLLAQQVVKGYPDGSFRPEEPVTRAEFLVLLSRALRWGEETGSTSALGFADRATIPEWARPAVSAAERRGIVRGYPDGTFRPQRLVTRAEAAVILVSSLANFQMGEHTTPDQQPPWSDWEVIPAWARSAAALAWEEGILHGRTSGEFAPGDYLKRGEAAAAVNRLLETIRS